ncbi:1-deoxy-D-xylulose-5-phosphate synthase [Hydrogenibacillus schlegelii]|uniref:1-deoxy-D-xylulose-5-phosphate synthase n=1 Tax=Hydrogenibacillus schlegelii TaxID=1484 RepID=A0A2T5GC25_HYDSH|nr:1-deoxy-D-xylulose-5-phosphate synthase [Hydrogenibacillus schlegelii]MBT9283296.1 1-deoxy-D-xylulose-5-phosphate synthase [Hydrogenibacillus schlegelii]PTQ53732.1 MAG: 1-deoxy-D-xylulose 5-phosphate synthase [Hydrogenibacillus schlegelii]
MLETIRDPADLRALSIDELERLAAEIRTFLITTLAQTGGHLAPNLGVVELTLALHRVFRSPEDRLIWDIGHQGYVHKIVTGRRERFRTLRQYGGLSGFLKRSESPHDVWEAGHASTSLSAAHGMAVARDLRGERHHVVAVIGDGALTGGMAYEALNNLGHEKRRVIVVLNDNEMSISPNVGAIHHYLTRIRTGERYRRAKGEVEHLLRRIPKVGDGLFKTAERLKEALKQFFVPGMWFEELGFTYLGPVDGHDLAALEATLEQAKKVDGPVLVHVLTKKGKGYPAAENDADAYHGTGPYKIETGEMIKVVGPPSYASVFARTLIRLAEAEPRLCVITPAMISGSGLRPFFERFPERSFDVGIAEPHAVTMAAGLAADGMKPVVSIYSTFLQRAVDQVIHDVALQKLGVVFAVDRAGLVGQDGETHQGVFDIPIVSAVPHAVIAAPKDENELQHLLYTAVVTDGVPFFVRYPRGQGVGVALDDAFRRIPIGSWEVLEEGRDLALLAVGPNMVRLAQAVADRLIRQGLRAAVINARFVKPLDEALLRELFSGVPLIATLEESALIGGFGERVVARYHDWLEESEARPGVRFLRFGLPDRFIPHGSVEALLQAVGLEPETVAERIRRALARPVGKARRLS